MAYTKNLGKRIYIKGVNEIMKKVKVCPICHKIYTEVPALSRKDNKTNICPLCGMKEALDSIPKEYLKKQTEK